MYRMKYVFAVLVVLGMLPAFAVAGSARTNVNVSARVMDVQASLSVRGPLDFGIVAVGSTNVTAGANFEVTMGTGVPYTIAIDRGQHFAPPARQMISGTSVVRYQITQASGAAWPIDTPVAGFIGTAAPKNHRVIGEVLDVGNVAAGTYSDVLTITVAF